jgi:hypothetical protein
MENFAFEAKHELGRVLINRDCSAIAGCRKRRVRIAPEAQAVFCRRRHQPRRPPRNIIVSVGIYVKNSIIPSMTQLVRSSLAKGL